MTRIGKRFALGALAALVIVWGSVGVLAQTPVIVQPGAPGEPTRVLAEADVWRPSTPAAAPADARFLERMIAHHEQALDMTALAAARTEDAEIRLLARKIELSQADEILWMEQWLATHGRTLEIEAGPHAHASHVHDAGVMRGMLTVEEMDRLAQARDREFDRLFLELMIQHHEGALLMVEDLLAIPGAGQFPEVFAFASEILAEQLVEIDRMSAMIEERAP